MHSMKVAQAVTNSKRPPIVNTPPSTPPLVSNTYLFQFKYILTCFGYNYLLFFICGSLSPPLLLSFFDWRGTVTHRTMLGT